MGGTRQVLGFRVESARVPCKLSDAAVKEVVAGSQADAAGMEAGDIVVQLSADAKVTPTLATLSGGITADSAKAWLIQARSRGGAIHITWLPACYAQLDTAILHTAFELHKGHEGRQATPIMVQAANQPENINVKAESSAVPVQNVISIQKAPTMPDKLANLGNRKLKNSSDGTVCEVCILS